MSTLAPGRASGAYSFQQDLCYHGGHILKQPRSPIVNVALVIPDLGQRPRHRRSLENGRFQ